LHHQRNISNSLHRSFQLASIAIGVLAVICSGCSKSVPGKPSVNPLRQEDNSEAKVIATEADPQRTTVKKPVTPNIEAKNSADQTGLNELTLPETLPENPLRAAPADAKPEAQPLRVTANKPPIVTRNGETYAPVRLNKSNTLMVLVMQTDLRADFLVMNTREFMTEDQIATAKEMTLKYGDEFDEILAQRNMILENATDNANVKSEVVESELLELKMDTADLIRQVRSEIHRSVLNAEQKRLIREKYSN
jgi:hypothetical protein